MPGQAIAHPQTGVAPARYAPARYAIVAGGGIGGLSAALALAQKGWRVDVLEQAPHFGEVGAGLQISPNGTRCLARLGVMERLSGTLFEPEAIELRLGHSGRRMFHLPLREKAVERWGGQYIHIHRADLANALRDALEEIVPGALTLGTLVSGYRHQHDQAVAVLSDGSERVCDLLVGADGVHSALRTQMTGSGEPRFTGNVAWRTTVPVDVLQTPPPPTACIWAGKGRHAVTTRLRSGKLVNFVGVVEEDGWFEDGWSLEGNREDALAAFRDFAPPVREIIARSQSLNRWALLDRASLLQWSDGAVVLLGDAAHPMLPSLAQGAVQAIEDAVTLAKVLEGNNILEGLGVFYDARIKRVTKVQRQSASNARMFHHGNSFSQALVYGPMALATAFAPGYVRRRNDWLFGGGPV